MESNKPRVLVLVDWFEPGFKAGGPIRSVSNLVKALQDRLNLFVLTSNTDLDCSEPYELTPDTWLSVDSYQVCYLSRELSRGQLEKTISDKKIDTIYLNSMFSAQFTIAPLRWLKKMESRPKIVLAPRGMLSSDALQIKKFKKQVFLKTAKIKGWYNGLTWHSTSPKETFAIRAMFGEKQAIKELSNFGHLPGENRVVSRKVRNKLTLLSVSRIAPIKNLHLVLRALQSVSEKFTISYSHVGPLEDENYWQQCQTEVKALPSHVEFHYAGGMNQQQLAEQFSASQVLILLSDSENFGHVVLEGFGYGLPAIVSDGTPWKNLKDRQLGFDLTLDSIDAISEKIEFFAQQSAEEYETWSAAARNYAEQNVAPEKLKQAYIKLLTNAKV